MIKITDELIDSVSASARTSARKRANHSFHDSTQHPVQRMINAMEPGTYVRPHRHINPDKVETFIILSGTLLGVEYDEKGVILDHVILNRDAGEMGVEFPAGTWHSFISLETGSTMCEFKEGPYEPLSDKDFALWAPNEGTGEASRCIERILLELGLRIKDTEKR